jgi:hypothetical protein
MSLVPPARRRKWKTSTRGFSITRSRYSSLEEGHPSRADGAHAGLIDVEQRDTGSRRGQRDAKGKADVPAPADDANGMVHAAYSISAPTFRLFLRERMMSFRREFVKANPD